MFTSQSPNSNRAPQSANQFAALVTVLFVSPSDSDWVRFSHILLHTNWMLYRAKNYEEAEELLRAVPAAVLVTEEQLPERRTWLDFLKLSEFCGQPRIIVAAGSGDVCLWAEVLNVGGYDVLLKPFDSEEVIRVVSLAWRNWKDELQHGVHWNPPATH